MEQTNSSISSFKKFIIRMLIPFSVILLLFLITLGFVTEQKIILKSEISGAYKVNRIVSKNEVDEAAIIGSSRAQGGFVSSLIGQNVFNYGIDGIGFDVELFFLKKELRKKKSTPIIINIDMDGFYRSRGDIMNYLYNLNDSAVKDLVKGEHEFIHRIPVLKYYGFYEWYLKYYLNERITLTKYIDKGGSFELNTINEKNFKLYVEDRLAKKTRFKRDSLLESEFKHLIMQYPERRFDLVVAPYHGSYLSSYINRDEFKAFFKDLTVYPNVRFFDFSALPLPDSCFTNTTHVNYKGALIFSKRLAESLASN